MSNKKQLLDEDDFWRKEEEDSWRKFRQEEGARRVEEGKSHIYPWKHVEACMDQQIEARPNNLPCPICGKPSEKLLWIHFCSPLWTWQNLCGTAGAMSICPDCHWQAEYLEEELN